MTKRGVGIDDRERTKDGPVRVPHHEFGDAGENVVEAVHGG